MWATVSFFSCPHIQQQSLFYHSLEPIYFTHFVSLFLTPSVLSLGHQYLVSTFRYLCPFFKLVSGRSASLNARAVCSTGSPLSSGFAHQETFGSPKFPGYPFEYMPRSSTPVVSLILAFSYPGLLPSVKMRTSAFPALKKTSGGYPWCFLTCPRLYKFRGCRVEAAVTCRPPHRALREQFAHKVPRFHLFLPR